MHTNGIKVPGQLIDVHTIKQSGRLFDLHLPRQVSGPLFATFRISIVDWRPLYLAQHFLEQVHSPRMRDPY